ncbi:MAG: DUF3656 domain-containing protein [Acholeplasmataceae bacterium]|nr:DUF3656 domain-containing protein [Acholeplasmataceae bacterium]
MKNIEILAPAGSMASLIGAINSGADAVYLAGKRFGARAYADNFQDDELSDVIRYAHVRGVLVYVTINTLVFDDEIDDLLVYTDMLASHHVDAFIVSDLGLIHLFTKRYPSVDIHVSTQSNTHHIDQVRFLKTLGVKRIVLARETAIETIKAIKKEVEIEIEVFVHGALCIGYSGQCLMSSMLGGRSGNRGECAQPCRLPYTLYKGNQQVSEKTYLLSAKDLMTIDHVEKLIDAGVDAMKIEGRMRKPTYVIQAVLSYKKAIKAILGQEPIDKDKEIDALKRVFNRSFTKGYLFDAPPNEIVSDFRPNHQGVQIGQVIASTNHKVTIKLSDDLSLHDGYRIISPTTDDGESVSRILTDQGIVSHAKAGDVITLDVKKRMTVGSKVMKTTDIDLEKQLSVYLDPNRTLIALEFVVVIEKDRPVCLKVTDGTHQIEVCSKHVVEAAITQETTAAQVTLQLSKLGNTPYMIKALKVVMAKDLFVPVKVLNEIRREAIFLITSAREKRASNGIVWPINKQARAMAPVNTELIVLVSTSTQADVAKSLGIKTVYVDDRLSEADRLASWINVRPRIKTHHIEPSKASVVINNTADLILGSDQRKLIAGQYMNVTNIHSAALLSNHHVNKVTLSPELSASRVIRFYDDYLKHYQAHINLEMVVYGRVDLMISKYCPIAKTFMTKRDCHLCEKDPYTLEDRVGSRFPLVRDHACNIRILNDKPLNLIHHVSDLIKANIRGLVLEFTTESAQEMTSVIHAFEMAMKGSQPLIKQQTYTTGRF